MTTHAEGRVTRRDETTALCALAFLTVVSAAWWALALWPTAGEPSAWLTASAMIAGFALAAVAFHLLRVRAALDMRRAPVAPGTIELHLDAPAPPAPGLPAARAEALPGPD